MAFVCEFLLPSSVKFHTQLLQSVSSFSFVYEIIFPFLHSVASNVIATVYWRFLISLILLFLPPTRSRHCAMLLIQEWMEWGENKRKYFSLTLNYENWIFQYNMNDILFWYRNSKGFHFILRLSRENLIWGENEKVLEQLCYVIIRIFFYWNWRTFMEFPYISEYWNYFRYLLFKHSRNHQHPYSVLRRRRRRS